jgi:hypothetical protein
VIAEILSKVGGNSSKVDSNVIHLSSPSIVQLKIAPEQVQKFERVGQDLKMVLPDGKSVVIEGFFDKDADGNRSDLVLEDNSGVLWWGQYPAQWDGFHFTEINEHAAGIPPWLWAGFGLLGLGGAAAGLAGAVAIPKATIRPWRPTTRIAVTKIHPLPATCCTTTATPTATR